MMADDTDSETLVHVKRRITETEGNQETTLEQDTPNDALSTDQNLHDTISVSKDATEISDVLTPGRFVSDSVHNSLSKKVKWSPEVGPEGMKGLYEYVNGGGETARIAENDLGFEKNDVVKDEVGFSAIQEISGNCTVAVEDDKPVLDVQMDSFVQECSQGLGFSGDSSVADENHGLMMVKEMGFDGFSETMSKSEETQFLKGPEIETQLVNLTDFEGSGENLGDTIKRIDGSVSNVIEYDGENINLKMAVGSDGSVRCSLKIEVIDDTALIESVPVSKSENGCRKEKGLVGFAKNAEKNGKKNERQEMVDGKKEKRPRRRGKVVRKDSEMNDMPNSSTLIHKVEPSNGCEKIGNGSKKLYSRKEMEALRFVNVQEQKKKWYEVYCGLGPVVTKEYDDLPYSANQKHIRVNFDPRQRLGKNYEASALPGGVCSQDVDDDIKNTKDNEIKNVNYLGPGFDHCAGVEDGYTAPEEECSEDSDGDEYYDSIHRPAFFVEGEPNFDSGPPEDGLEYLRRVRWEAAKIPKVKVVKIERSKINKEQTVYMPSIPEIAKCPDHLLPSKQWEDVFLADFEELRLALSRLEGSIPENDVNGSLGDYPTLSTVIGMDSVARVSMLRRRIGSVKTMTTLSRSDCVWLFALCAAVDTPLDADMSAALRCLLRKCASLRAEKSELDDEVVMLNILVTISGRYFRQAEN